MALVNAIITSAIGREGLPQGFKAWTEFLVARAAKVGEVVAQAEYVAIRTRYYVGFEGFVGYWEPGSSRPGPKIADPVLRAERVATYLPKHALNAYELAVASRTGDGPAGALARAIKSEATAEKGLARKKATRVAAEAALAAK